MSEQSKWKQHTRAWQTRDCGVFQLWAGDGGMWEIATGGEMVTSGRAVDPISAKFRAEEALRELLTKALSELGELRKEDRCGYPYDDGVMSTVCFRARGHGGVHG